MMKGHSMLRFSIISNLRILCAYGLMATSAIWAAEVKVEGVHLCCGKCVKAATGALTGVAGVSAVNVSQDDETVTFQTTDEAATKRGLASLAKAGFYGETSASSPDFKIAASKTGNEIHISHLHLCCGGCVKTAEGAAKSVSGVQSVSTQPKQGTMTVHGDKVNYAAMLKAFHEAGMHGTLK